MAFAPSENFNSGSTFTPFESIDTFRARFPSTTKIMVAIGGWGDNAGFSTAAVSETSRSTYAKNVAAMLQSTGLDGVGRHFSSRQCESLANTIILVNQISTGNIQVEMEQTTRQFQTHSVLTK